MAVARSGLDDGHRRFLHDRLDESGATARDEHIDQAPSPHERRGARPSGGVHTRHQIRGQTDALQGVPQDADKSGVGPLRGASAAQHDRIAGLQGQSGHVDGDVGAGLVDHADHAHGHAHTAHLQPVGESPAVDDLADRIGQAGDLAQGGGDGGDAPDGEGQSVDQPLPHARPTSALHVDGVGGQNRLRAGQQPVGHGVQPGVLELAAHA